MDRVYIALVVRCYECLKGWFNSLARLVRPFDAQKSCRHSRGCRCPPAELDCQRLEVGTRAFVEGLFEPYQDGAIAVATILQTRVIWSHRSIVVALSARSTAWSWQQSLQHFRWARPTRWSSGSGHVHWRRRLSVRYVYIYYILLCLCFFKYILYLLMYLIYMNLKHI